MMTTIMMLTIDTGYLGTHRRSTTTDLNVTQRYHSSPLWQSWRRPDDSMSKLIEIYFTASDETCWSATATPSSETLESSYVQKLKKITRYLSPIV